MRIQNILHTTGGLVANVLSVQKNLSDRQLSQVGGISIGLAGVGLAMTVNTFLLAFPDREDMADKWAKAHQEDYRNLCYTNNPETETGLGVFNGVTNTTNGLFNKLSGSGPIGRNLAHELTQSDTIFCFGPRHVSGADFYRPAPARNIYFTANDLRDIDTALALHLFERRGLYPTVDQSVRVKENHFITSAALIWKRSNEAMKVVVLADATYDMINHGGREVFSKDLWDKLETTPKNQAAASAYRMDIQSGGDQNSARKAAFYAAYDSPELQQESDLHFMQWYRGEVDEQPETRTRTVPDTCTDSEGKAYSCTKTETYTVYVDPEYYVHSEDLHPATLSALSDIFMDGQAFLNFEEAATLISDPASIQFHDDATRRVYDQALRNAKDNCRGHYKGEAEIGRGLLVEYIAPDMH